MTDAVAPSSDAEKLKAQNAELALCVECCQPLAHLVDWEPGHTEVIGLICLNRACARRAIEVSTDGCQS